MEVASRVLQRTVAPATMLAVTCAAAAGMLTVTCVAASGQSVTGAVYDSATSAPLPGVLVAVVDDAGERVGATLSDAVGRFAIDVGRIGRFRLRAERIGLRTMTSEPFEMLGGEPHFERIYMTDRAVAIAGLIVDARVRSCSLDREQAVRIQRWWLEVRTALDVSSVVQNQESTSVVERFEREWDADLDRILHADTRRMIVSSSRPFVGEDAEFLAENGYVQSVTEGQRDYFAPDADVLLSNVFLARHCFALEEHDDERLLGLTFEPIESSEVTDVRGTLWVDTTTAELQSLDFRYTETGGIPDNESGGYLSFRYLASGAWIVDDWYIRMPKLAYRGRAARRLRVVGYLDVGGRVSRLGDASGGLSSSGAVGEIRGFVHDSIQGRGLAGARVSVLGTRHGAVTDEDGGFRIRGVPVGTHSVAFFHADMQAWGLGSSFVEVDVTEGATASVELAVPGFRQVARLLCLGSGSSAETILVGRLLGEGDGGIPATTLEMRWRTPVDRPEQSEHTTEARTSSDGRFVVCSLPGDTRVHVRARIDGRWTQDYVLELVSEHVAYAELRVTG